MDQGSQLQPPMDVLRKQILRLRYPTAEPRHSFVPIGALSSVLNTEVLRDCLKSSKAPLHRVDEIITLVRQGGCRTFAILIMIRMLHHLMRFVESDELQRVHLDSRLPYTLSNLESILLCKDDADEFFEQQWEFTAPVFRRRAGHRSLHDQTVFPFLESKYQGSGARGTVYKVELHPQHGKGLDATSDKVREGHSPDAFEIAVSLRQIGACYRAKRDRKRKPRYTRGV